VEPAAPNIKNGPSASRLDMTSQAKLSEKELQIV